MALSLVLPNLKCDSEEVVIIYVLGFLRNTDQFTKAKQK